jgi:hypothetical protein
LVSLSFTLASAFVARMTGWGAMPPFSTASPDAAARREPGSFPDGAWAHRLPHSERERSRLGRGLARARPGTQAERAKLSPSSSSATSAHAREDRG